MDEELRPFTEQSEAIWQHFQSLAKEKTNVWYDQTSEFWNSMTPSNDGMLGGFGSLSGLDAVHSLSFIRNNPPPCGLENVFNILDVGSGIGRISKNVLLPIFFNATVHLLEPSQRFLDESHNVLSSFSDRVGNRFCLGFHQVSPQTIPNLCFDVVFIEWVLLYLTDADIIAALQFCKERLSKGGIIYVKENCTLDGGLAHDEDDNSVTRPVGYFDELFTTAGFTITKKEQVPNWPTNLFPVYSWSLK
ncbi:hypothetical protein GEMRC1_004446 [Eukaryota sp. GEM-RC1]